MQTERSFSKQISPYSFPGTVHFEPKIKLSINDLPMIIKVVEDVTGISVKHMKSPLTSASIAISRHLFVGISDALTDCKRYEIMEFVNRDKSTFRNSFKCYSDLLQTDEKIKEFQCNIKQKIFRLYNY